MKCLGRFFGLRKIVFSSVFLDWRRTRFCSYSTLDSGPSRRWSYFSEVDEEESSVFKHTLKFQRPSTIDYNEKLYNSVNLIGTVLFPLKRLYWIPDRLGFDTILKFKSSSDSSHHSSVRLIMWDKMAEVSILHLKPDDLIYVWGDLHSIERKYNEGICKIFHEVHVKEMNYISQNDRGPVLEQTKTMNFQGEGYGERRRKRLLLWQTFFVNPFEWNDYRKNKRNPKSPDFIHKSTGEALWINPDDPPWISTQLKSIDSLMSGRSSQKRYIGEDMCSFLSKNQSSS